MEKLKDFQKLVIANAQKARGLKIGEVAPNFTLLNAFGTSVSLADTLKKGPVVLKFYRGEWCPICNLDLIEVQQFSKYFKDLNAQVLAISPQKPDDAMTVTQKNELSFEVLSDSNQEVIKAYKLQFNPGEDYLKRRDLSLVNGDGSVTLPIPATYIINKDFTIIAAHVEANYTERLSAKEILDILNNNQQESKAL